MQVVLLITRPGLETGRVARHGGEIAVVQPVQHLLALFYAAPLLSIVGAEHVWALGGRGAFFRRFGVVGLREACADEEDVADVYVATLGCGADVEFLSTAASGEGGEADARGGVGVVGDRVVGGVGGVVEEDAPAADVAAVRPVVDAVFEVGRGALDVGAVGVVVECPGGYVGDLVQERRVSDVDKEEMRS